MQLPSIQGTIDRRILVNFRADPDVLASQLPSPFRPLLINDWGMAGICLIRLTQIRPWRLPAIFGLSSENAAHRIAVEWDHQGQRREGVYVPRRDTSSRLNSILGGTVFPGEQHHARFRVDEADGRYSIAINSDDRTTRVCVDGKSVSQFPTESVFGSLEQASRFFERGSVGYSATHRIGQFDGLELCSRNWSVTPFAIDRVESSFFENRDLFPAGSLHFDCALLMRGIEHEWHGCDRIRQAECGAC
jgi:hypothetical protein